MAYRIYVSIQPAIIRLLKHKIVHMKISFKTLDQFENKF